MRQGATLIAKAPFAFKVNGKGRTIRVQPGQRFWITNSEVDQKRSGFVTLDREGRGCISHGYAFTAEQVAAIFELEDAAR